MKKNIKKSEPQQTAYLLGFRQWATKVKNTPVIIKFVFQDAVRKNKSAKYICVNLFEAAAPVDIQDRSICIAADCGRVIEDLLAVKNKNI